MKKVCVLLAVLAMAATAGAMNVVFEDFEGLTQGAIAGQNGWTGPAYVTDYSAAWGGAGNNYVISGTKSGYMYSRTTTKKFADAGVTLQDGSGVELLMGIRDVFNDYWFQYCQGYVHGFGINDSFLRIRCRPKDPVLRQYRQRV